MRSEGPLPRIDVRRCSGCGSCVAACRQRRYTLESAGYAKVAAISSKEEHCIHCHACADACRMQTIEI